MSGTLRVAKVGMKSLFQINVSREDDCVCLVWPDTGE